MKQVKLTKSQQKQIAKQLQKINPIYWVLVFVFLVVGVVAGYFTVKQLTKNDLIELNGETTKTYPVSTSIETYETYTDPGVKAIVFGKELSHENIKIESDMEQNLSGEFIIDLTTEAVHYIKYTIKHISFGEVVKYRTIIVGGDND